MNDSLESVRHVGASVRKKRLALHLTQDQLAQRASVSRGFVSRLEQGHPRAEFGKVLDVLNDLELDLMAILGIELGR